ncbi:MAG TPA: hypothetical protein VND93_02795, partial [Myxococcales bacterium]|nr:hypothetical protein [Myxococcales bacterium]
MSTPSTQPASAAPGAPSPEQAHRSSGSAKRQIRNYLLDARFQLKFTAYIVAIALCVATILGAFLWSASKTAMEEAEAAAVMSKETSNATLSNTVMEHLNDPAYEAQIKAQSDEIDAKYEAKKNEIVKKQQVIWFTLVGCMAGFVLFIGTATIITTHHIVGPLFRI